MNEKKLYRILRNFDLRGKTFIGLDPANEPKFLTETQRVRHVEVIGLSGTGKTRSVITPMIFQDICEGKCVVSIDGKSDLEFADAMYGSCLLHENFRKRHVPDASPVPYLYLNPALPEFSNTYNPVYTHCKTDLDLLTERVFRAFQITHEHWGPVGLDMLKFLIRALYAMGKQFSLADIYVCLWSERARECLYKESQDKTAVWELKQKFGKTERSREDAFAQFKVKLSELNIPMLCDYNPDIIPEDLVKKPSVLCVSLPESHKTLSYGIGNMLMEDFKVAAGKRFRDRCKDDPACAIYLDEAQYFLNPKVMLSGLTQFRGANFQLVFSHHCRRDLRIYSQAVADTVWINSQNKIILPTNDPETSQIMGDTIGTKKTVVKTYITAPGPLLTTRQTFEASNQEADAYENHPNFFKKLRPVGQGFMLATELKESEEVCWALTPLNFACFPSKIKHPLPKPLTKKQRRLEGLHFYERFTRG